MAWSTHRYISFSFSSRCRHSFCWCTLLRREQKSTNWLHCQCQESKQKLNSNRDQKLNRGFYNGYLHCHGSWAMNLTLSLNTSFCTTKAIDVFCLVTFYASRKMRRERNDFKALLTELLAYHDRWAEHKLRRQICMINDNMFLHYLAFIKSWQQHLLSADYTSWSWSMCIKLSTIKLLFMKLT